MDGAAFHDEDLNDILREFDEAIMDFHRGPSQYEEYLEQKKQRNAPSACDSGIEESESGSSSPGSSLNGSEENLTTQSVPSAPKAKLGDTRELEDFIADLDKVLEGM